MHTATIVLSALFVSTIGIGGANAQDHRDSVQYFGKATFSIENSKNARCEDDVKLAFTVSSDGTVKSSRRYKSGQRFVTGGKLKPDGSFLIENHGNGRFSRVEGRVNADKTRVTGAMSSGTNDSVCAYTFDVGRRAPRS